MQRKALVRLCAAAACVGLAGAAGAAAPGPAAAPAGAPAAQAGAPEVFTRAVVRSIAEEDGGRSVYVRLKLVPTAKIPFSTLTYRVPDRRLLAGLREGDSVAFRAERRGGENVLTAVRVVPPCRRFEPCE